MVQQSHADSIVDTAVAEGGAYEVIQKRLIEQGKRLGEKTRELNQARLAEFGGTEMKVAARVRVRTENNCIARDIVQVGEFLLFGYNVFIGLKKETRLEDVFALFALKGKEEQVALESIAIGDSFLAEPGFKNDFEELYRYYKHTRLVQLTVKQGKLLAGFQIGERLEDLRVFRWSVSADGKTLKYIDNRGERDIQLPPSFDFEWSEVSREDSVHGRHPHFNILDTLFVETTHGDLTIKVENNTEDGLGIYREPVEDKTQSLDDASIFYASVGGLILLKVLPYREQQWRYFIFNKVTRDVLRIDAIGESCVQLPEDHGVIFPGGFYLQTGEYKAFNDPPEGLKFKRMLRSPNGEDVLYVFYEPQRGVVGLFAYNLIEKALQNPIYGHGYALAEDGTVVIFSAEGEPTRVHPMQIWMTPFASREYASKVPASQTFYGRVGNAELVRGVSDLYSICRIIDNQSVSARLYEELGRTADKMFDAHYWIEDPQADGIGEVLREITATAELVIDEFEKVESIKQQSAKTMAEAEQEQEEILQTLRTGSWETAEDYVAALERIRRQRGHLTTIRDYRYIDVERIAELDQQLLASQDDLGTRTVEFLSAEEALAPYLAKIDALNKEVEQADTNAALTPLIDTIEATATGLDLLSELMATLQVQDATQRTRIIDAISAVYSKLNQSKAGARHKQKNLGSEEAVAQFAAQFKLFSQSVTNALGLATTPERCDEQLSRLLVQLEELEGQFSDYDRFLGDIVAKRDEIYESFETHKQQLLDQQQRKAQSLADAAARMLASIERRSLKFTETDALNTYFAADALVIKIRELVEQLRGLDSAVQADEIEARFKSIKEQALRSLRDKSDIYEDGGNVIKLGPRHKFSVNTQDLDLTIIPREGDLYIHLTGTGYFEKIEHPDLADLREYWDVSLESESAEVYRSEYLAAQVLQAAERGGDFTMADLTAAMRDTAALAKLVRDFAAPRYREGYEKGVHDHDAELILRELLPALERADLLRYDPDSRGLAQVFWCNVELLAQHTEDPSLRYDTWVERAQSASLMYSVFASANAIDLLVAEVTRGLQQFLAFYPIDFDTAVVDRAAAYLVAELGRERVEFICSKYASELVAALKRSVEDVTWRKYQAALDKVRGQPAVRWQLSKAWLEALVASGDLDHLRRYIPEAVALINSDKRLDRRFTETDLELTATGLLGEHPTLVERTLHFAVDEFLQRLQRHQRFFVAGYRRYHQLRQDVARQEREALRLEEFKPKPLSSFVRNRLINEAYLPIIGDNLAKQMGTVGENKRTDLMGLLMMISPPGYGKTTLMEYVASRLGLIFMKINCPSLGHDVLSLDPQQAPNATARQELVKLNLALEMGNNVMLYLDDIQHTHPEFLQKFISLCDGTRRVEGVWKGKTKTYDMRGRKFCVVMAGNPYTESGEVFKIPDMLANRADIYNLGDILGGMDEQFSLSYIENSLTSNPVLAPLATREMGDVYKLIRRAQGESVATTDLSHAYSGAEINEIEEVLRKLFVIQDIVLKINQQYIASAAQDDKYRREPAFKLQGSYRNMNKMAEKVSAVMNEEELLQMISDHYIGESQLLTSGSEENLLKLAQLRGNMTGAEAERWDEIKRQFLRNKAMGGDDAEVGGKVVVQLTDLVEGVNRLHAVAEQLSRNQPQVQEATPNTALLSINKSLQKLGKLLAANQPHVEVVNQPVPGMDKILQVLAETIEHSIFPLVRSMDKKLEIDLRTHDKMQDISEQLRSLEKSVAEEKHRKSSKPNP
ncbi:AAA family ATPase [Exilibacterium tricleocarpae]|uniref:AAA family ATPase n=1 Tax=Exilibacterium tricleocarpae TaxID=2591008 RepID=A0A545TFK9_9GAMM|nr:DNA repair ATPase [Exilibacterium tricleocarpae]TQV75988.1 AAA family ATPase [Exilibacterium tricleocarpae]